MFINTEKRFAFVKFDYRATAEKFKQNEGKYFILMVSFQKVQNNLYRILVALIYNLTHVNKRRSNFFKETSPFLFREVPV